MGKMNLKDMSLAAIFAVSYNLVYRLVATVLPEIFENCGAVAIAYFISIAATSIIMLFFIAFRKQFIEESRLSKAATFGIIGSASALLPRLFTLSTFLGKSIRLPWFGYVQATLLLIGSIAILLFFAIVYREFVAKWNVATRNAALAALIGSALSTIPIAASAVNLYSKGALVGSVNHMAPYVVALLIAIQIFATATIINFFVKIRSACVVKQR